MKHTQPQGKKQNRSVSLYPHQREAFNRLGGSKWLQEQIEAKIRQKKNVKQPEKLVDCSILATK
jgi:hypothetical protein